MDDLAARALNTNQAMVALGNEQFEADGALFIRNRRWRAVRSCNHVGEVTATTPEAVERLLARAEREFAGVPHRSFVIDYRTPPVVEARLALDDYKAVEMLIMVLEGELRGKPKSHDIRPVSGAADWAAYAELQRIDWRESRERMALPHDASVGEAVAEASRARTRLPHDASVGEAVAEASRARTPPFRIWFASVDGESRAHLSSWGGIDGMGQVEDLFTHPDFRHRGLATALLHHCVADARQQGAAPVMLVADPHDTPKEMYAAMGFRPVAAKREYWKNVGETA